MTLVPKGRLSLQWHSDKMETFFVLEGTLYLDRFEKDGTKIKDIIGSGESVTILPCQAHSFYNESNVNVIFIEISTTHKDEDVYRVTKSGLDK